MPELAALNALPAADFVAALDGIYEHSPWVAERVAERRPFGSRCALHDAMQAAVLAATDEEQLALIRAHPQLAGKAAIRGELTADSTREQAGAGLSACSPEEFARLHALNTAYEARFGFPFIMAVKGHGRAAILAGFESRLAHHPEAERAKALDEIGRIAEFRLRERVQEAMGADIMAMAERLKRYSEQEGALTCTFLSEAHRRAARQIRDWMIAAGLDVEIDAIGNVVGRLPGDGDRTLLTGSHYDTVIDGGAYDGRLGVLLPIAVAETLRRQGRRLPCTLEIIAFSDEEGVRFGSTFLGSSAVAGRFDTALLDRRDAQGIALREALDAPEAIPQLARDPARLAGYVEVHIEQGPVLLDAGRPLGVVTAINGSLRYAIAVQGVAGHAGTVPMTLRHDAAAAAAEIVLFVEQRCRQASGLVGTVGRLEVPNGAVNVVPGRCTLSLDLRAPDDAVRDAAARDILDEIDAIAARRGVRIEARELLRASATPCDPALQARLADSIRRVTGEDAPRLPSGAGHDAMALAAITEVAMLFVRCGNGGISHHPAETLTPADAELAAQVLLDFLS